MAGKQITLASLPIGKKARVKSLPWMEQYAGE